jgi:hypothetical protein
MRADTLTLVDNRTGKSMRFDRTRAIRATDLRQVRTNRKILDSSSTIHLP